MERTLISETAKKVGEKIRLCGWIQIIRDQGTIKFLILRDRTGIIQAVSIKNAAVAKIISSLSLESVVEIVGTIKEEKQAPGGMELTIEEIKILSSALELPIPVVEKGVNETKLQKRLDWRWLDLRKTENLLIFKVWTLMEQAFREYWIANDYVEIHSPKLMNAASESGAELFEVKYFDKKAYLAQSPQFYKQMAMAAGFEKVFEVGPVFRANPSFTSRHDTEFTSYDIEISFIESHQDVIEEEEKMLVFVLNKIKDKFGEEIEKAFGRKIIIPKIPFPQLNMKEAKEILRKMKMSNESDNDLNPGEERKLCEFINKEKKHEFVWITEYPVEARPFYHMCLENNTKFTKSFDLLWNGLEITTGAQREHRYDVLKKQVKEKKVDLESIKYYLDFFKFGCPPHGGFGLGPTRMLMKIFNIENVREVTFLYRGVNRLTP